MKKTVKQRVLDMLESALHAHDAGMSYFYFQGPDGKAFDIPLHEGYIPQSHFCNPRITGSTEGKRRLRELRQEMFSKYKFEIKRFHGGMKGYGGMVGYRIKPRQATIQSQLQMAGRLFK